MPTSAYETYLESRVLTADPIELVRILYRLAIDRIREAREHLQTGDVGARGKAISTASQALGELARSLDFEAGGEVSLRLGQLYEYMQLRLVEANYQQSPGPLTEVLALLSTLSEAWQQLQPEPHVAPPEAETRWREELPEEAGVGASQSWSA
jgi:flagellar protein FliS